MKAQCNG